MGFDARAPHRSHEFCRSTGRPRACEGELCFPSGSRYGAFVGCCHLACCSALARTLARVRVRARARARVSQGAQVRVGLEDKN